MPDPFVDARKHLRKLGITVLRQSGEAFEGPAHCRVQLGIGPPHILDIEQIIPAQRIAHVGNDLERTVVPVEDLPEVPEHLLKGLPVSWPPLEGAQQCPHMYGDPASCPIRAFQVHA